MKLCCPLKTVCLFGHENHKIKEFSLLIKIASPEQHCAALKIFCQQLYKPEKSSKSSSFRSQRQTKLLPLCLKNTWKRKICPPESSRLKRTPSEMQAEKESCSQTSHNRNKTALKIRLFWYINISYFHFCQVFCNPALIPLGIEMCKSSLLSIIEKYFYWFIIIIDKV